MPIWEEMAQLTERRVSERELTVNQPDTILVATIAKMLSPVYDILLARLWRLQWLENKLSDS